MENYVFKNILNSLILGVLIFFATNTVWGQCSNKQPNKQGLPPCDEQKEKPKPKAKPRSTPSLSNGSNKKAVQSEAAESNPDKMSADAIKAIVVGCHRRSVYTRMHAQISPETMFASLSECLEIINYNVLSIRDSKLRQIAQNLVGDIDTIERQNTPARSYDFTKINQSKLNLIKGLIKLSKSIKIDFTIPDNLIEAFYFTVAEANKPPQLVASPDPENILSDLQEYIGRRDLNWEGREIPVIKTSSNLPAQYAGRKLRVHLAIKTYYNLAPYSYMYIIYVNGVLQDNYITNNNFDQQPVGIGEDIETADLLPFEIPSDGRVSIEVKLAKFNGKKELTASHPVTVYYCQMETTFH